MKRRLSMSQLELLTASREHQVINGAIEVCGQWPVNVELIDPMLASAISAYEREGSQMAPKELAGQVASSYPKGQAELAGEIAYQLFLVFEAAELVYPIINWKAIR